MTARDLHPFTKRLQRIDAAVVNIEKGMIILLFLGIAILVGAGIFARLTWLVLPWTNEAAQILLVWMIFIGANLGTHFREHVGVTILPDILDGRLQVVVFVLIRICIFGFSAYVVWAGWNFVSFQKMVGGTTFSLPWDIPKYLIALVLPMSFFAGCLHVLTDLLSAYSDAPYAKILPEADFVESTSSSPQS
jgi:TRAP-type C4-dicarboxylate transport system permease small subunit